MNFSVVTFFLSIVMGERLAVTDWPLQTPHLTSKSTLGKPNASDQLNNDRHQPPFLSVAILQEFDQVYQKCQLTTSILVTNFS